MYLEIFHQSASSHLHKLSNIQPFQTRPTINKHTAKKEDTVSAYRYAVLVEKCPGKWPL